MEGKFIIHVLNYVAYEDRTETKILDVDGKNVFTFEDAKKAIREEMDGIKSEEGNFSDETFQESGQGNGFHCLIRSDGTRWEYTIIGLCE